MNASLEAINLFCRDGLMEKLGAACVAHGLDVDFLPLSSAAPENAGQLIGALQSVVVSPDDLGLGAVDENIAVRNLCAQTLAPIIFLYNPNLDSDDREAVAAEAKRRAALHDAAIEVLSGGALEFNRLLTRLQDERDQLKVLRDRRLEQVEKESRVRTAAKRAEELKTRLATYLNIRLACDAVAKNCQRLERVVDDALATAQRRLSEGTLNLRVRSELESRLPLENQSWVATTPGIVQEVVSIWQAEQVNNFLGDIGRETEVSISFESKLLDGGLRISAEMRPTNPDFVQPVLRASQTAFFTNMALATLIPFLPVIALPAAVLAGAYMWRKSQNESAAAVRARFIHDIGAPLSDACRVALLETSKLLRTSAGTVREELRSRAHEEISVLLSSPDAMSDDEASLLAKEIDHMALRA